MLQLLFSSSRGTSPETRFILGELEQLTIKIGPSLARAHKRFDVLHKTLLFTNFNHSCCQKYEAPAARIEIGSLEHLPEGGYPASS